MHDQEMACINPDIKAGNMVFKAVMRPKEKQGRADA
jgi:hypothetical protein